MECGQSGAARLARLIEARAPHDGTFDLPVPGLHASRASRVSTERVHALQTSSLCLIAQGGKTVMVGQQAFTYDAARMIVFSVAVPVAAQVTQASHATPYLAVRLDPDPRRIAELVLKVHPGGLPATRETTAAYMTPVDPAIVGAAARLMECLDRPGDAELLAPLTVDEIMIRLLRGPVGPRVAQIGLAESGVHRVARAVDWLRTHLAEHVRVEDLAGLVHMSASSFHEHFRSVTSMSPLRYQKVLRLQEARRLMLATVMDATTACQRVGYASPSQFSRDYRRFFGSPPTRDVARLRHEAGASA